MKAPTFVGLGCRTGIDDQAVYDYDPATYLWEGKSISTKFFPVALCEFFKPEREVVFVTKESKERYWDELYQELDGKTQLEPVEIPWGGKPDELWTIFDLVVASVSESEDVLFDITHGFRSLPFVVFLAVAYLRLVKNIHLRGIVYGAFEARDSEGRAPVFDLSSFLSLLDWLAVIHLFRTSGVAADLSRLLKDIQAQAWRDRSHQGSNTSPSRASEARARAVSRQADVTFYFEDEQGHICVCDIGRHDKYDRLLAKGVYRAHYTDFQAWQQA